MLVIPPVVKGQIHLDFDVRGRLTEIEIPNQVGSFSTSILHEPPWMTLWESVGWPE